MTNNSGSPGAQQVLGLSGVQQVLETIGDFAPAAAPAEDASVVQPAPLPGQLALPWSEGVPLQLHLRADRLEAAGRQEDADYARRQAQRMPMCGEEAVMACVRDGTPHRETRTLRCEVRLCPYCGRLHGDRIREVAERLAIELTATRPDLRVFVVTFTTRKPPGFGAEYVENAYAFLGTAFPHVWQWFRRRGAEGACGSIETGQLGMCHGHLVVLASWDDNQREAIESEFADYWRAKTSAEMGDPAWRVEVALAKGLATGEPWAEAFSTALVEAVAYPMGGSARPGDRSDPQLQQLAAWTLVALRGRRRLRSYGLFYAVDWGDEEREPGCDDDTPAPAECPVCGGHVFVVLRLLSPEEPYPPSPPAPRPELRGLSPGAP